MSSSRSWPIPVAFGVLVCYKTIHYLCTSHCNYAWGGLARVICQRVFDGPEAICHSAFSCGWEICHYGAHVDFSPLPSEGGGEGRESSNF